MSSKSRYMEYKGKGYHHPSKTKYLEQYDFNYNPYWAKLPAWKKQELINLAKMKCGEDKWAIRECLIEMLKK